MDWISVDTGVMRDVRVASFADAIGVQKMQAIGHLVSVWSALAEQSDERGHVASISDDLIEEWAIWRGRKSRFAKAFRQTFQLDDGTLRGWEKRNGAHIRKARLEAERKRAIRAASAGQSADADADETRTRAGTGQDSTEVLKQQQPDAAHVDNFHDSDHLAAYLSYRRASLDPKAFD
ncbi:MAG: hypothetical protein H3C62_16810, partial [Gemmatimonadaceae bacterium]|nr:hypothetical protein [Gemmatimonadaceae bacterium]